MAEKEFIPGFDSLGFRVETSESEKFEHLLKSVWASSTRYSSIQQIECGEASGEYYKLWTSLSEEGVNHILEVSSMPGVVGAVEEYLPENQAKVWIDSGEESYLICLRSNISWFYREEEMKESPAPLSVSVIAQGAEFFENEAALASHPELSRFSSCAVVPVGLFVEGDAQPTSHILVLGEVILAVRSENDITSGAFHALRVRTLGGEVWIALPDEAIDKDKDVTGSIVAVQGIAYGTFPFLLPLPDEKSSDEEGFNIDPAAVENGIRKKCTALFSSEEFEELFHDLHIDSFSRKLSKVFGIISKTARRMPTMRGLATDELAEQYRRLAKNGSVVLAQIVMANTMVLYRGMSAPALVVIGFGDQLDEVLAKSRSLLSKVHFGEVETDQEKELAKLIEDEEYQFGRRRRLPFWLVGDKEVYAADLYISKQAVHGDSLDSEVIVCLAEPGPEGLTIAVPASAVQEAISEAKRPVV